MSDAEAAKEFINFVAAAMFEAAAEGKCSQLQTTISPPGGRPKMVRIIVVPEEMGFVRGEDGGPWRRPA